MLHEGKYENGETRSSMKHFTVQLTAPLLYDKLHTLSAEYSISAEMLVNVAVRRLIDDVDFVRSLRSGQGALEPWEAGTIFSNWIRMKRGIYML